MSGFARYLHRSAIILLAALCAAASLAQTGAEFAAQGDKAYAAKEYAKGAELYSKAYTADPKKTDALYNAACCYALSGQKEEAFAALETLCTRGYSNIDHIKTDSDLDSLHTDPRWDKIVAKVEENDKKSARWRKPFEILKDSPEAAVVEKQLGSGQDAVWLEGDILTFARRSKAETVRLTGGIQEAMTRTPDTDIWTLRLRMVGWDKAFASYGFIEGTEYPKETRIWKGANAPVLPAKAEPLKGTVTERTIHSDSLGQDRKIHVYLPPNAPKSDLPAVWLADGGSCAAFAAVLEPLILSGKVRPCAIVGVPPGAYGGDPKLPYDVSKDLRAMEYLHSVNPEWFAKHLKFFTDEVAAYVAKEFGISTRRADRAVTGYSNGGAFAAAIAVKRPEFFAVSMPLSLGIPPDDPKPTGPMPDVYFAGGTLETFGNSTNKYYESVKGWGMKTSMDFYVAGHDQEMWKLAFSKLMPKAFPPKS